MKKILVTAAALLVAVGTLTGCGDKKASEEKVIKVAASATPHAESAAAAAAPSTAPTPKILNTHFMRWSPPSAPMPFWLWPLLRLRRSISVRASGAATNRR